MASNPISNEGAGMNAQTVQTETLRAKLAATTHAVVLADTAHLQQTLAAGRWRRRGLLRRLTRGV
jgi:hypothetical protein